MSEQEQVEPTGRPGATALSLAGITELVISATLFGLKVYAASMAFGLGALFVAIVANTISRQSREMQRSQGIAPPPEAEGARRRRQVGFVAAVVLGTVAVIMAVVQLIGQSYMPAAAFGIWALCCTAFALRFR